MLPMHHESLSLMQNWLLIRLSGEGDVEDDDDKDDDFYGDDFDDFDEDLDEEYEEEIEDEAEYIDCGGDLEDQYP